MTCWAGSTQLAGVNMWAGRGYLQFHTVEWWEIHSKIKYLNLNKSHPLVQFALTFLSIIACLCCQAMYGTSGCRQTLWGICTGLWSRPICLPRLSTDQPAAWSTSAHLSAEWMTPYSMTSSTDSGSSIAHLRYDHILFWAFTFLHICAFYYSITNYFFHLFAECPSSRHKPVIRFLG